MTEVAIRQDHSPALIPDAAAGLVQWAQAAQAAFQLAKGLVSTTFVPQNYRGKPDEAAAAILAGSEVGLSPMASLRAFDNIQGTATPKAITIRAVMLRLGCEIEVDEQTSQRCIMRGRRTPGANWTTVEWTMDRARKMGLDKKQQWTSQPGAMLVARATSELGRLIAADALLGLGYTSEEIADDQPEPTAPVSRQRTPVKRTPPPQPPEPEFDEPAPEPVQAVAERTDDRITDAQSKALHAGLNGLGITDRDAGLAAISQVIERDVSTSKDLTKAEASRVIEWIKFEQQQENEPTLETDQ